MTLQVIFHEEGSAVKYSKGDVVIRVFDGKISLYKALVKKASDPNGLSAAWQSLYYEEPSPTIPLYRGKLANTTYSLGDLVIAQNPTFDSSGNQIYDQAGNPQGTGDYKLYQAIQGYGTPVKPVTDGAFWKLVPIAIVQP